MVKVNIITNNLRTSVIVNETDTLRKVLINEGVKIGRRDVYFIDGFHINKCDLKKPISALGFGNNICVIKTIKAYNVM